MTNAIDPAKHLGIVHKIARQYVGGSQASFDDLVQEGAIGALKAAASGRFDSEQGTFAAFAAPWVQREISAYLQGVEAVRAPRKDKLPAGCFMPSSTDAAVLNTHPANDPNPEDIAAAKELRAILWDLVDQLSERTQIVIKMRFVWGKTHAEIGESLGVSRQMVQQIEGKALKLLRARLQKAVA